MYNLHRYTGKHCTNIIKETKSLIQFVFKTIYNILDKVRHSLSYKLYYVHRCSMRVLQYLRYCNTSGSLMPLPCRVVNHCLVVQVLNRTEGLGANPNQKTMSLWQHQGRLMYGTPNISRPATVGIISLPLFGHVLAGVRPLFGTRESVAD